MTNSRLYAALAARLGSVARHILPGEADHLAGPDGRRRWMAILDDRSPGSDGPATFDGRDFAKVLGSTTEMVVDFSEQPDLQAYDLLAEASVHGARVLVIQTTPDRAATWREFLCRRWTGSYIAEILPVSNCPTADAPHTPLRQSGGLGSCWPWTGNRQRQEPQ